ncbi:MAG: enoyl-CoA hydratase/isomerase family protein [Acidobacteria bacterium]|nr:MAG: enoyl-CoA hydratase/isomerase family protein [Acidobacteriota bacterium]
MEPPTLAGLDLAVEGNLGRMTLNRPEKLNPLATEVLAAIADAAAWFDTIRDVKVVVVAGEGRAFSAGADISGFAGATDDLSIRDRAELGSKMADSLEAMRAVTVAKIHGYCIGGAVVLASACDFRVAAESTKFSIPEVDLGIPLTWGGIPRLIREIGAPATRDLVMTCRQFGAGEAERLGLIQRVVPDDSLDDEVEALAQVLLWKAALPLLATKRNVDAVTSTMIGRDRTWADADSIVSAYQDDESRQAAYKYVAALADKRKGDAGS